MGAKASQKTGFNATWSMAVGGMVAGGIFSVLGVVLQVGVPRTGSRDRWEGRAG